MSDLGRPGHDDPFVPAVQTLYWLGTTALPSGDPEEHRAVVVLAAPNSTRGTVTVVARSGADDFGIEHPADRVLGLSAAGRFSRRQAVQCQLWTAARTRLIGPLDDATFAAVLTRFGW